MVDPYYERLTIEFKVRKWLEAIWPTIYNLINGLVVSVFKAFIMMIRAAIDSLKGFGPF